MKTEIIEEDSKKDIYKSSRVLYWIECAFEYLINILCGGAFLAKLTGAVGISDGMTAIMTSIVSFAALAQFASIYISHRAPVKRFVIPIMFISHALMAGMFLLPFIGGGGTVAAIFFITFLVARFMVSSIAAVKVTWFFNLVPDNKRGAFAAIANGSSLVAGTVFSLVAGFVIDEFEAAGNLEGAFLTLSLCILAFAAINLLTLLFSKEKPYANSSDKKEKISESFKSLLKNKNYMGLFVVQVLVSVAGGIAMPFFGTYQINELGFTVSFVAIITAIQSTVKLLSVTVFGKISLNKSHRSIILTALPLIGLSYFIAIFTAPQNGSVLYPIFIIVFYIGLGGYNVSDTNILLATVPEAQQTSALSLNAAASGVITFFTTVAASPLIEFMQSRGNEIFGFTVYAQQILSVFASLLYFAAAICMKALVKTSENRT